jgi:AraC-like DNA-binding protein
MSVAEKKPRPRALGAGVMRFERGAQEPMHIHAQHAQLKWPTTGLAHVRTPRGVYVVPPSHALWIPAGREHGGTYVVGPVCEYNLYVHEQSCVELPGDCSIVRLTAALKQELETQIARAETYEANSAEQDAASLTLLARELRDSGARPLDLPLATGARVQTVLEVLRKQPGESATRAQWARRLEMSTRSFERAFDQEAGMSFGAFRRGARLLYALERLAQGGEVARIAAELGYQSDSAFIYMFRRSLGTTPSRYFA